MGAVVNLAVGDPVSRYADYVVDASGEFDQHDLVQCRRYIDPEGSRTCAFLASTIAGIDDSEVQQ